MIGLLFALAVSRILEYLAWMTKQKRWRKRQSLRKALARIVEVMADNIANGIRPDRRTARLAWQVVNKLQPWLTLVERPAFADVRWVVDLRGTRQRETAARYRFPQRGRGPKKRRDRRV
jgi:hypothetical protein